jgi:hypothetical protein
MNLNKYMFRSACAVVSLALCTGCSDDDDNWSPGEQPGSLVYFENVTSVSDEVMPNEGKDYVLTLTRENAEGEATVALSASDAVNFDVPASVTFADGVKSVEIPVQFKATDSVASYLCTVSIADSKYVNPYTQYATSANITVLVADWEMYIEDAYFFDTYGALEPYEANIYKLKDQNRYRIINFASGYNFDFELQESAWVSYGYVTIHPLNGLYCSDPWWGYNAWAFSEDGTDSDFSLRFDSTPGYYYTTPFLFDGDSYNYLNPSGKYGLITIGFIKYADDSVDSDDYAYYGYTYLNFTWE